MKLSIGVGLAFSLLQCVSGEAEPAVQRLVSRRLQKRDSGYANGGNQYNSGKGLFGWPKNLLNYELSFYHINDVHAYVSHFCSTQKLIALHLVISMNSGPVDHLAQTLRKVSDQDSPLPAYSVQTIGCVGGYSRVKTVIDQTRPTKKNALFLNAGDEFQVRKDLHSASLVYLSMFVREHYFIPCSKGKRSTKLSISSDSML